MSLQIQGKFIASEAIDGEKLLLSSGQAIRLTTASGEVRLIELDEVSGKVKVNGVEVALSPDLVAEVNRALAAEAQLAAGLAAEVAARAAADSTLATAVQSVIEAETVARIAGDAATLSSAQAYADQKVADLVASAPAVLDTLKELADALGGDANFANTISGQIGAANAAVDAEESRAMAAESALQVEIDAVESALAQEVQNREIAVEGFQDQLDAVESALVAEQNRAQIAETLLQSQIDELTGGSGSGSVSLSSLDARLNVLEDDATVEGSVAKAEADAKQYADSVVFVEKTRAESVEAALQGEVNAVESALAQEVSDRSIAEAALQTAIDTEASARLDADSALSGRLDVVEGTGEGSVAKAEADAKAYADQKIADLIDGAPGLLDTLNELAAAIGDDANFASSIATSIANVQTNLNSEITARQNADAALQGEINAEELRAAAAEAELAIDIAQEIVDRAAAITALATSTQALIQAEADARVADVNSEESRALAAETSLANDIAAEESRALAAEETLQDNIDIEVAARAAAVSAEQTRAESAEAALDGRLDVLEARQDRKMRFVLSAQDISNGYIELEHQALPKSVVAAVGRLMIHECEEVVGQAATAYSDDYFVTVVSNKTRLMFVGNLVAPSEEQLSAGDVVFVKYVA